MLVQPPPPSKPREVYSPSGGVLVLAAVLQRQPQPHLRVVCSRLEGQPALALPILQAVREAPFLAPAVVAQPALSSVQAAAVRPVVLTAPCLVQALVLRALEAAPSSALAEQLPPRVARPLERPAVEGYSH